MLICCETKSDFMYKTIMLSALFCNRVIGHLKCDHIKRLITGNYNETAFIVPPPPSYLKTNSYTGVNLFYRIVSRPKINELHLIIKKRLQQQLTSIVELKWVYRFPKWSCCCCCCCCCRCKKRSYLVILSINIKV